MIHGSIYQKRTTIQIHITAGNHISFYCHVMTIAVQDSHMNVVLNCNVVFQSQMANAVLFTFFKVDDMTFTRCQHQIQIRF